MPESRPGRGLSDGTRAYFLLAPTRGAAAARELFGDYDGVVMADRYAVYEALEHARTKNGGQQQTLFVDDAEIVLPTPDYTLTACWMHARRGFVRAARHGDVAVETALDLIAGLYARESKAARVADLADPEPAPLPCARPARRSAPPRAGPSSTNSAPGPTNRSPCPAPPSTTRCAGSTTAGSSSPASSRTPRSRSTTGSSSACSAALSSDARSTPAPAPRPEPGRPARLAALFYSLIASCRLVSVDAHAYLLEATRRALLDRDAVFLPEDFAALGDGVTTTSPGT